MNRKRVITDDELASPLVPYEQARAAVLAAFRPLDPIDIPLIEALDLVAAEDVRSEHNVPDFDNSAMDGYAVRAQDTPGELRLIDDLPAGTTSARAIGSGTAAKIMTGAPIPPGADAVVPWEDTDRGDPIVRVETQIPLNKHIRPRGEDIRAGDVVVRAGTILQPVHIGVLASIGRTHVRAHPRPRVAILSTGDELDEPGSAPKAGHVFDANRALLRAMCEQTGARITSDALIPDDPDAIASWLRGADADLIVTSGGASVGEHDWIRAILEKEGTVTMWRVAIKPGKPIAFGTIGGTLVLGLPGNPGSAFVGAHVFVQPAIRTMAGRAPDAARVTKRLGAAVRGSPSRTSFVRVKLDGEIANPMPAQSSVVLSNLIGADGLAIVEPGGAPHGTEVVVELLSTAWSAPSP